MLIWIADSEAMSLCRYHLQVCAPGDLIIATLAGFFSLADVESYAREAEALIERCSREHGGYRILIDISDCAVQPQEVTAAFNRHVAAVPRSERVAVVTSSPMIRMQIRRIVGRRDLEVFEGLAEAQEWIGLGHCLGAA
jgi:hypothetical protein